MHFKTNNYRRDKNIYQPAYNEEDLTMFGYPNEKFRDGLWTFWRSREKLLEKYPNCIPITYNLDEEMFDDCEPTIIE